MGRPKKVAPEAPVEKRKRGRPKKASPVLDIKDVKPLVRNEPISEEAPRHRKKTDLPEIKVGDTVEIVNWAKNWEGVKGEVVFESPYSKDVVFLDINGKMNPFNKKYLQVCPG